MTVSIIVYDQSHENLSFGVCHQANLILLDHLQRLGRILNFAHQIGASAVFTHLR